MNSPDTKLREAELDAAITDKACDWQCQQGRAHDCPMPEEWPPLNRWTLLLAIAIVAVTGFVSRLFDGWAR